MLEPYGTREFPTAVYSAFITTTTLVLLCTQTSAVNNTDMSDVSRYTLNVFLFRSFVMILFTSYSENGE